MLRPGGLSLTLHVAKALNCNPYAALQGGELA